LLQKDNGDVAIWEMNGGQISQSAEVANPGTQLRIGGTGDFNADGHTDVLFQILTTSPFGR
jgi:hypothetical protein